MKYKAVVFDLDGTLLNTIDEISHTVNSVLARHNLPQHDVDSFRQFIGDGVKTLVYRALPTDLRDSEDYQKYFSEVMIEYANNLNKFTQPYAGINELLTGLTNLGIKMAILSNKADQFMAEVVDNYFSAWSFEVVFGARHGIPVKPDPTSALEVASIMQLATSEIIYIGDSDVDMKTAHGANMLAIGAGWGLRGREELLANGAHAVIEHPLELLNWFN